MSDCVHYHVSFMKDSKAVRRLSNDQMTEITQGCHVCSDRALTRFRSRLQTPVRLTHRVKILESRVMASGKN